MSSQKGSGGKSSRRASSFLGYSSTKTDRKGSTVTSSRRGSSFIGYGSTQGHNSLTNTQYDVDETLNIPNSIIERRLSVKSPDVGSRRASAYKDMPNLVGYSATESVYLLSPKIHLSTRKWLIVPISFLYMAAYFSCQSVFTQYIYKRIQHQIYPDIDSFNETSVCYTNKSDPNYEKQTTVQQKASEWSMYFSLAAGVPAIFCSIIFGSSSDKYGRKLFFFLPLLGALVKMTVCVVGIYLKFDLVYFLIGFVFDGLSGYVATLLLITFTYVADITPPRGRQRSLGITLIELFNGIGITLSNFGTGYFIQDTGFFYPMLACGIAIFIALVLVIFLPESFPRDKRNPIDSVCDKLKTVSGMFFSSSNSGRRWMYHFLMLIFELTVFSQFSCTSVETLYLLNAPFCWTPEKLGYYSAVKSLMQNAVGMGLFKVLQKVMSDESIAMLGCVSYGANYVIEGLAQNDVMLYIGKLETLPFLFDCFKKEV